MIRRASLLILFLSFLLLGAANAFASPEEIPRVDYPDLKQLKYRYGPVLVRPGQNSIRVAAIDLHPKVDGYITRFKPDMVLASDGSVPASNVIHMHHVAWLVNGYPTFLGVEEKTITQYPRGFGLTTSGNEWWRITSMIHNWTNRPERVYLTWDIDFIPKNSPTGRRMKPMTTKWMDVSGVKSYPVFDALRGRGSRGRFVFPAQARGEERKNVGMAWQWRVEKPVTLVHAISHLHPGGLYNDLTVTRAGRTRRLFRSYAKYYQAAGPVSWNASLTASRPDWRVKLQPGDLVRLNTTYDTSDASWHEVMGIMPLAVYYGWDVGGVDAFDAPSDIWKRDMLTHGELPENRAAGGMPTSAPDPRTLPDGPPISSPLAIKGFRYRLGDASARGSLSAPPVVPVGGRISFINLDSTPRTPRGEEVYHTVTACRAPCSRSSGLSFPLADGQGDFDSGQLGFGLGVGDTPEPPSANRNTWSTPRDLSPGTYTFFCRIHPFMRGAFRVKSETSSQPFSAGWQALGSQGGSNE